MKSCAGLLILLIVLACFPGSVAAADDNLKAATDAAKQWLAVVDAGQYGSSWEQTAAFFQERVNKPDWEKMMNTNRAPLGTTESRQFKSASYETNLPHAPAGQYFILQFTTKFSNAPAMIETVVPMLEKNGQWKVSGYFIKPAHD